MSEFSLDKFKYTWRGAWSPNRDYIKDDVVRVNGKTYICIFGHTASSAFRTDQEKIVPGSSPPIPQPRWAVMTSSRSWQGSWETNTNYNIGDIVEYNGTLFVCLTAHLASSFPIDSLNSNVFSLDNKWYVYALGQGFTTEWESGTNYSYGSVARYNGNVYICITPHTSFSLADLTEQVYWEIFYENLEFVGTFITDTLYKINDIVKYGGALFRCVETYYTQSNVLDISKFEIEVPGTEYRGEWGIDTPYNQGDLVRYGGYIYYAVQNTSGNLPSLLEDWLPISIAYNFRGLWDKTYPISFKTGDIVQYGGFVYEAIKDSSLIDDNDLQIFTDITSWKILVPSKIFVGAWTADRIYNVGDVILFLGSTWECNTSHVAALENIPGDNGKGFYYWDLVVQAGVLAGMQYPGDLLTYGLQREYLDDLSTLGPTRIPIGIQGQTLSVTEEYQAEYRSLGINSTVVYVAKHGQNTEGFGLVAHKPFKTVRYACQWIEDNVEALRPSKIFVATGRYDEVGPITVPAGCVIFGDELRSTTIVASDPKPEYTSQYQLRFRELIEFLASNLSNLLDGNSIQTQVGGKYQQYTTVNQTSESAKNAIIENMVFNFFNEVNYYINTGNQVQMTGSNNLASTEFLNAVETLKNNLSFLIEQGYLYLLAEYPTEIFNQEQIYSDTASLLRGAIRDLEYSGNYATLTAARGYANHILGSAEEDLFWMRDTTGLRNLTIEGLFGSLGEPQEFTQVQVPTGGSCVALDPGWGPDDNRVWIVNRSPYIQGVTNFGTACYGMVIDGNLHNGGNSSMVANDFTQVLSDGVGIHVKNNGRSELVSVFTYYCQIGYWAENGGIIRATNGNNSYGNYGAIAQGNDDTEIPQIVTVNNRKNHAQVSQALAGGNNDEIIAFEYLHCGEQYSSATGNIVGAGDFVSIAFSDFRNGSLFQGRLINTSDSGNEGGAGYTLRQNEGQPTQIVAGLDPSYQMKLNSNEEIAFESDVVGLRIVIVQGAGVGQYGYISAYDLVQKAVTVAKDNGDQGWDHIIPGYPLSSILDGTSVYRIEPRLTCVDPETTYQEYNFPALREFVDVGFGNIRESYADFELLTPDNVEDIIEICTFTILKNGYSYQVVLQTNGAGYKLNDSITIPGNILGGTTPENDAVVRVTEISNDSVQSVVSVKVTGNAKNGIIVALTKSSIVYKSTDGTSWQAITTQLSGDVIDLNKIQYGANRFVAIAANVNISFTTENGEDWITNLLPVTEEWKDITYGLSLFIVIGYNTSTYLYSSNGYGWFIGNLPTASDSSGDEWVAIEFGATKFVVISESLTRAVAVSGDGYNWTLYDNVLPQGPGGAEDTLKWKWLKFGNSRFLAMTETGETAYSLNHGETWYLGTPADNSYIWSDLSFAQGVFVATTNSDSTQSGIAGVFATTEDGIIWKYFEIPAKAWKTVSSITGKNSRPTWIALADNVITGGAITINTGATAKIRGEIKTGSFDEIKIWDPGSGYTVDPVTGVNSCQITVFDTVFSTKTVEIDPRIGNGVLGQPDFLNRGNGYRSSSSQVTITGNGYADIIEEGNKLVLDGVDPVLPGPGVQIKILGKLVDDEYVGGILDDTTEDPDDLKLFSGLEAIDLGDDGTGITRTVEFKISPRLRNEYNVEHGFVVELRQNYSQCRITGHDFLDIGTGGFDDTNYPELYAGGRYFIASPENEVAEINGGRVFYVSTDQDGNFRTGELFGVQQSTGIVTISAEFFDLDGLSELSLGGVRLGGTGTIVNEFSTDATFSADSNNIIPTQKAIATFLADRLSVGGSDLEVNNITAGLIQVGGIEQAIKHRLDGTISVYVPADFSGTDLIGNAAAIKGSILAQLLYFRSVSQVDN